MKMLFCKKLFIKLLFLLAITAFCAQAEQIKAPNYLTHLNELLNDFKNYKTTSHHRGDLYEHSLWAEQYLSRWACGMGKDATNSWIFPLIEKLTEREKYILAIAGLLHDVGKAGDPDCSKYQSFYKKDTIIYYFSKKDHERIGFDYVMHDVLGSDRYKCGYRMVDGTSYNLGDLLHEFGLNKDEQCFVAVLIGSHKIFSDLYCDVEKKGNEAAYKVAKKKLKELLDAAGCLETDHVVDMVVLITVADLYATYYPLEDNGLSLVFGTYKVCKKVHDFTDDKLFLETLREKIADVGLKLRNKFKDVQVDTASAAC